MKKKSLLIIYLNVCFLLFFSIETNSQTLLNPSFEFWTGNCPINIAPNDWTNFSSSLGPDQAGNCAGNVIPYEGDSHMNLVWYETNSLYEGASQSITDLEIGKEYEMSFYAVHDQGLYAYNDNIILDVYLSGNVVFSTPELSSGFPWYYYSVNFFADSVSKLLAFKVRGGTSGLSGSVGVDAIHFTSTSSIKHNSYKETSEILYPNPFSDYITIEHLVENISKICIYDHLGRIILTNNLLNNLVPLKKINTEHLSKGSYFYEILDKNNMIHKGKIIKN
jgi:hypothetical protein